MMSVEEKLIEEVKNYPALYNKSSRDYTNTTVKIKIWNQIASNLLLSEEVCQNKWRNLRDRFCKEYRKHSTVFNASASGTLPSWELWPNMAFLQEHIKPRQIIAAANSRSDYTSSDSISRNNKITDEEETQIDTDVDMAYFLNFKDPLESSSSTSNTNISKNDDIRLKLVETMTFFNSYLAKRTAAATSPAAVQNTQTVTFCKVIADIIDNLQPSNRIIAKSQILKLLSEMQLQEDNVNS